MTDRIALREVVDGDLPIFFDHWRDRDANRMAAFTRDDPDDREAFNAHWARIRGLDTVVLRTIVCGDAVVGHISKFERDGNPEVTYWIGKEHWGKGIATRALRLLLDEVSVRPIWGGAAADNAASIRVLEKCGFKLERRERGFAPARGEEIDEVVMKLDDK